ncbi:MAG: hypothetical protein RL660_2524 [Bacteroidota bacterium]|jgi:hypothetical protein
MKIFKHAILTLATTLITLNVFGQANPFINVLPSNSGIVAVGCTIDIIVTVGNTGPGVVPQAKLRPVTQVPTSVTFLPTAQQTGLPTGWTILSNSGSQLRVCNSTDPIPAATSRIIVLKAIGVAVTAPQTFSGNINFGNGTTCGAGTAVTGDLTTDNSALSTVEVVAAPTLTINSSLTPFTATQGNPSAEQSFSLTGSDITEDVIVTAPTGFEVSNTSGTGFASTAIVTPTLGVLSSYPVYIRLAASATLGAVSGNVVNASSTPTCVTPQSIAVSGQVNAPPLSVTLINFSAKTDNCEAQLNWTTSSETNCEKFEIEKAETTSGEWKTIGSVIANGNSSTSATYNYTDENIFANTNVMYRLKIIDKDASFTYSQVLNTSINCDAQNLVVFPNPVANGKLTASLNGAEKVEANLTSVTGQQIKKVVLKKGANDVDVSELSNGVYFLNATFVGGISQNVKVSIQK